MARRHRATAQRRRRARRFWRRAPQLLALAALAPIAASAQVAPTSLPMPGDPAWHYTATIYAYLPSVGGSSPFPADSGGTSLNVTAPRTSSTG